MITYNIQNQADSKFHFNIDKGIYQKFGPHKHHFTELTIITSGTGKHFAGKTELTLLKGSVFVIPPTLAHEVENIEDCYYYNIQFNLNNLILDNQEFKKIHGFHALFKLEPLYLNSHNFSNSLILNDQQLTYVVELLTMIYDEYSQKKEGYQTVIKANLNALIAYLSRQYESSPQSNNTMIEKIAKSLSYIENNFDKPIKIKELADIVYLSTRQYHRIFTKIYGVSPLSYILSLKIKKACSLIKTTNLSMSEIANQCGYYDNAFFSKQFKEQLGITPKQYREKIY